MPRVSCSRNRTAGVSSARNPRTMPRSTGIFVETIATLMSMSSTIAASRVNNPMINSAPQTSSHAPTKWSHDLRHRDADFGKAAGCKLRWIKKLLNSLGQKNAAGHEPHQNRRYRRICRKETAHRSAKFGRELREIVNAKSLLDSRYLIYDFLEPVLTK